MDRYPSTSYPEVRFWCLQTLADAFRRDVGANADVLETLGDEECALVIIDPKELPMTWAQVAAVERIGECRARPPEGEEASTGSPQPTTRWRRLPQRTSTRRAT